MKIISPYLEDALLKPLLTEKSTALRAKGVYVFKVLKRANKHIIKHAVESYFDVKVESVRVINVKPKIKGSGLSRKRPGRTRAYKKAYVKTKGNAKISSLES